MVNKELKELYFMFVSGEAGKNRMAGKGNEF